SKHGLGFVLGDEGSGTYFGRKLITGFLYGNMPPELSSAFAEKFRIDKEIVIKKVYQQASPNSFLASFAPFMSEHTGHPYISDLLKTGFDEFADTNIKAYTHYRTTICHFVGSIAYHFSDILQETCNAKGIRTGKILKHPIEELSNFIHENGIRNYY